MWVASEYPRALATGDATNHGSPFSSTAWMDPKSSWLKTCTSAVQFVSVGISGLLSGLVHAASDGTAWRGLFRIRGVFDLNYDVSGYGPALIVVIVVLTLISSLINGSLPLFGWRSSASKELDLYKKLSEVAESESDREAMRILKDSAVDRIIRWNNKWNVVSVVMVTVFYLCSLAVVLGIIASAFISARDIVGKMTMGAMALGAIAVIVGSAAAIASRSRSSRLSERRKKDSELAEHHGDDDVQSDERDDG